MSKLTQKRLKEVLHYDPETGIFTWKIRTKLTKIGDITGYKRPDGYLEIGVDGKTYLAHRLVWFYVYGYFPENDIDHIDRIKHHNWIKNLREVSRVCNLRNTGNQKNNTSGIKGVSFHKQTNKWSSYIMVNKAKKHLGLYKSFDNAACARLAGEQCLNWSGCDSSSPAYQYVQKMLKEG